MPDSIASTREPVWETFRSWPFCVPGPSSLTIQMGWASVRKRVACPADHTHDTFPALILASSMNKQPEGVYSRLVRWVRPPICNYSICLVLLTYLSIYSSVRFRREMRVSHDPFRTRARRNGLGKTCPLANITELIGSKSVAPGTESAAHYLFSSGQHLPATRRSGGVGSSSGVPRCTKLK